MSYREVIDLDFIYAQNEVQVSKKPCHMEHVSFVLVDGNSPFFKIVKNGFKKLIAPTYGDQKKALEKIKLAKDRNCELMFNFNNPLGIIVYKNSLQDEYGFTRGLELKTLFLLNPEKNSGNGFGSYLFRRAAIIAKRMNANLIYCTASSKVENSMKCALKNGYVINRVLEKHKDHTLYLLTRELHDE